MKRLHTYSQNFLRSPKLVDELIKLSSIKSTDTVYDIGAGSGIITTALAERCRQVIAIETEPGAIKQLEKNTAGYKNITIKHGDFLGMPLPDHPYKVFSNIPFHISSEIVQKITADTNPPTDAYLVVQRQFANRLLSDRPGFGSQLGMLLGPDFSIRIARNLKRTDFMPHPNVDTALLEIRQRKKPLLPTENLEAYREFIQTGFSSPDLFAKLPLGLVSRDAGIKPSGLTLAQWLILFQAATMKIDYS